MHSITKIENVRKTFLLTVLIIAVKEIVFLLCLIWPKMLMS